MKVELTYSITYPQSNEPWKSIVTNLEKVSIRYDNGSFDEFYMTMFGVEAEEEFFNVFPEGININVIYREYTKGDNYYDKNSYRNSCFNKTKENPYQLPNWKKII